MKVEVITDTDFIARIKAKSVRAPERDVPSSGIECWREYNVEHFFLRGAYLHSIPMIPMKRQGE